MHIDGKRSFYTFFRKDTFTIHIHKNITVKNKYFFFTSKTVQKYENIRILDQGTKVTS